MFAFLKRRKKTNTGWGLAVDELPTEIRTRYLLCNIQAVEAQNIIVVTTDKNVERWTQSAIDGSWRCLSSYLTGG